MNQQVMEERLYDYADEALSPQQCIQVTFVETLIQDGEEFGVWLLETDLGTEYWALDSGSISLIRKSALIHSSQRALASYLEHRDRPVAEVNDRFHQE